MPAAATAPDRVTWQGPTRQYPARNDMLGVASSFRRTVDHWRGEEGPRTHLTVAAGVWRVWDRDAAKWEARLERKRKAREIEVDLQVALGPSRDNAGMVRGRNTISGWSAKSRNRMKVAFSSADWTQLFDGTREAAMVTLTLPHDWVPLAPTARDFKTIVNRWQAAYAKAWGERISGGWKMEFQGRRACVDGTCSVETRPGEGEPHDPRAPHLHILTVIQPGSPATRTTSMATGAVADDFRSWLSISWAKACRTREVLGDSAAALHESAGTGVDPDETIRYGDVHRMAVYFEKHGQFSAKAYQNDMPDAWNAKELGGAQFWGLWGVVRLNKSEATVEIDARVGDQLARSARRKSRAEGVHVEREVWRGQQLPETMLEQLRETAARLYADETGSADLALYVDALRTASGSALRACIKTLFALISAEDEERLLSALRAVDGRWRRVWVDRDGEVRLHRKRRVTRRLVRFERNRGFQLVNDGVAAARDLARLVEFYGRDYGLLDRPEYDETAAAEAGRRRRDVELVA